MPSPARYCAKTCIENCTEFRLHNLHSVLGKDKHTTPLHKKLETKWLYNQEWHHACREDTDAVRKHIVDLVRIALESPPGAASGGDDMLLSRSWLRNWRIKQCRVSHLSDGTVSPTFAIMCRHGRLLPDRFKKECAVSVLLDYRCGGL
jgi:hypothetical protein